MIQGKREGNGLSSEAAAKQLKEQPGILLRKVHTLLTHEHLSPVNRLQPHELSQHQSGKLTKFPRGNYIN